MRYLFAISLLCALLAPCPLEGSEDPAARGGGGIASEQGVALENDHPLDSVFTPHTDTMGSLKILAALGLVTAVALAGYLQWHRRSRGRSSEVKLVSVTPIGQKEKIAVVEVMGERLVLGVTSHQISLLCKREGEEFRAILEKAGEP